MTEGPYRPDPNGAEADAELARLAAQGQRRIRDANEAGASREAAAALDEEQKGERNIRIALGAYYGTPLRTASLVVVGMGVLAIPGGFFLGARLGLGFLGAVGLVAGVLALLAGLFGANVIPRVASRARVDAERAWVGSLPFALDDYFELLAAEPILACRLVIELTWEPGRIPAPEMVRGVLGLWDPGVGIETGDGGTMSVRGSPFECGYSDDDNGRSVLNRVNDKDPVVRVHRLVDHALLPLHRSHAIARVSVRREETPWQGR